jgi:hypothetical protein
VVAGLLLFCLVFLNIAFPIWQQSKQLEAKPGHTLSRPTYSDAGY